MTRRGGRRELGGERNEHIQNKIFQILGNSCNTGLYILMIEIAN